MIECTHGILHCISCKLCRKENKIAEKKMVASGEYGYYIFRWRQDGLYLSKEALSKCYKSRAVAEKRCAIKFIAQNAVVRLARR